MPLEPKIAALARSHLQRAGALRACPMCGETSWEIADLVVHATLAPSARGVDPTRHVTLLLVECEDCRHVVPYNATKIPGLLPKPASS